MSATISSRSGQVETGIDRETGSKRHKQFNLLRSFALTSLVVMIIIGGIAGTIFGRYMTQSLLARDAEVSQAFLQSMTEVEGGAKLFRDRIEGMNYLRPEETFDLPELVQHIATMPGVVRANLYSDSGEVIWSTQPNLVGKHFEGNDDLDQALAGKRYFELKGIKEGQKAEYADFPSDVTKMVENYLPIIDEETGTTAAVVEIYKAPKTLFDTIDYAVMLVWICVVGATLFLYSSLFWIVYRANLVIRSQQLQLVESETMVAVGEMASAVAHSIRNPLAAIRSSAELNTETSSDPAVRETADDIITEIDRVEQWIRELLIFSRPEGSTQFKAASLDQIMQQCLEGYSRLMKRNGIDLEFDLGQDIPSINGDPGLLGQMFNSVLANSIEAMPDGGVLRVDISTTPEPAMVRITISDTGHGIPAERLEGMFETFLTTKRYGLGIGMLLSSRIAKRHGGSITVQSEIGEGTTTIYELPAAK